MGATLHLQVAPVAGSADLAANTSAVHIVVKITTDSGTYNQTGKTLGVIRAGGAQLASLDGKWVYRNTTTTLYDALYTAQHEPDGRKQLTVEAEFDVNTPMTGLRTARVTVDLPAIPRCASLTVPPLTLGAESTVAVQGAEGLTWAVDYTLGGQSGNLLPRGSETSFRWTPPVALAAEFPAAPRGEGVMHVTTWSGEAVIGEADVPFTVSPSAALAPRITALAVSLSSDTVPEGWNVAVRGRTRLAYRAEGEGQYGADIVAAEFTCGEVTAQGMEGVTDLLSRRGDFTPRITLTDSRGLTAAREGESITVHDYALPAFTHTAVYRCTESGAADDEGLCCAVEAAAEGAALGGHNTLTLRCRYRAVGGGWSGYTPLTPGAVTVLPGFALAVSYEVEVEAVDALGGRRTVSGTVPTAAVAFHLREGGCGAAFGKYAERDGWLESDWDMDLRFHRLTGLAAPADGTDAVNLRYLETALAVDAAVAEEELAALRRTLAQLQAALDGLRQELEAATAAPEMVPGTEYATGEKWNGAPVYAQVVDYGALPNSAEGSNNDLAAGLNVIDIRGFAVGESYIIPLPGHYAVENMGYTRSGGNLWISTTRDLSGYHGYITVKYTK